MRQQYAQKRQALAHILAPLAQLRRLEAGLHAYLELRSDLDVTIVAQRARRIGQECCWAMEVWRSLISSTGQRRCGK